MRSIGKYQTKLGVWVLAAVMLAGTGGCIRQTDTPIIAERTEEATAEQLEEAYGSKEDLTGGASGVLDTGNFIQEYADAPARYEVKITEAGISLSADAPLMVPEISRLPHLNVAQFPYEDEERDAMLELLSEELDVANWLPDDQNQDVSQHQAFRSEGGSYLFSFVSGKTENQRTENRTPIMWLIHQRYSDGTDGTWDASDLSDCSLSSGERASRQAELEQKAETLMKKMDVGTFSLQSVQWKRIGENGKPTDRCGLKLTYVRALEGIPVLIEGYGWAARTLQTSQYVNLLYLEDGTLLELKNIGREQVVSEDGYADSLLSFDAVAQIFEQYMRYYQTVFQPEDYAMWLAGGRWQENENRQESGTWSEPGMPAAGLEENWKTHLYIHVTGVSFGYQLECGNASSGSTVRSDPTRLVPVWAFYGTPILGYHDTGSSSSGRTVPEPYRVGTVGGLLVTVNAEDGTVYGKVYTEELP